MGHFENRRGTKLAPVKLNNLKMPVPAGSQKSSSSMSFMPKGASLSKNIRRVTDDQGRSGNQLSDNRLQIPLTQDDFNESANSDEGSKYSYEETDDDAEKSYDDMNQSDVGSQLSPTNSADDSPEAFDINSLVQLGAKLPPRTEDTKKLSHLKSLNEDQAPSLNLRKGGQPSFLKPLQQVAQKKPVSKTPKKSKKVNSLNNKFDQNEAEKDLNYKISLLNEEQKLMLESIQKEWAAMQKDLEREEKVKYEKLVNESSKRYEEEESLLRQQNTEKLSKLKSELMKKFEEEETAAEINLAEIKKANELKYTKEQQNFNEKLKYLADNKKTEMEILELKNTQEIAAKKKKLEDEIKNEIEELENSQKVNLQKIKDAHANEISLLEEAHRKKVLKLQDAEPRDTPEGNTMGNANDLSSTEELQIEIEKIKVLLKEEKTKYQDLLNELDKLRTKVEAEKEVLRQLEEKTTAAQTYYEEMQDEVDKAENDLDLLRTEKSALVSELNVLKGNIKSEKSNLQHTGNQLESPKRKMNVDHKAVNTNTYGMINRGSQTCIELISVFCQTEEFEASKKDGYCQTFFYKSSETADIACQTTLLQREIDKNSNVKDKVNVANDMTKENTNIDSIISKVLENAMMEVNNKMEARFKSIEDLVGAIQKNVDSSFKEHINHDVSNANVNNSVPSKRYEQNGRPDCIATELLPLGNSYTNKPTSSKRKCSCEQGDSSSCDIMQDVKNSVYRLNDILSSSLVPSINRNIIHGFNHPVTTTYTTCLESFYSQFQKLQEKQRVSDLKHKCQNSATKQHRSLLNSTGANFVGRREQLNFNNFLSSTSYDINLPDDPVSRARNLVVREQARSWKQQQQFLNSPETQDFLPFQRTYNLSLSNNVSPSASRISSGFSERSTVQYPFLRFGEETDPESEYNEWMSRLKALQDKIRSHKFI